MPIKPESPASGGKPVRSLYAVPQLVLLGDLRSLTLSFSGGNDESGPGSAFGLVPVQPDSLHTSPPVEGIGNPFDLR